MLSVMLLVSIVLGLIPLAGVAWFVVTDTWRSVDGLFGILILLSISGIFFLNVFWELQDSGLLGAKASAKGSPKPTSSDE